MRKGLIVIAFLLCLPNLAFALTFSQLPTNPQSKQAFTITDASSCVVGSAVTAGGGPASTCDIFWNGTNWIAYSTTPGAANVNGQPISPDTVTTKNVNGIYYANGYGVVADGQVITDGAITAASSTLTSTTGKFVATDVGKLITVQGAGATAGGSNGTLVTTIAGFTSPTTITLTNAAVNTVSSSRVNWGTDNAANLVIAYNAAKSNGIANTSTKLVLPPGRIMLTSPFQMLNAVSVVGAGQFSTFLILVGDANGTNCQVQIDGQGIEVGNFSILDADSASTCALDVGLPTSTGRDTIHDITLQVEGMFPATTNPIGLKAGNITNTILSNIFVGNGPTAGVGGGDTGFAGFGQDFTETGFLNVDIIDEVTLEPHSRNYAHSVFNDSKFQAIFNGGQGLILRQMWFEEGPNGYDFTNTSTGSVDLSGSWSGDSVTVSWWQPNNTYTAGSLNAGGHVIPVNTTTVNGTCNSGTNTCVVASTTGLYVGLKIGIQGGGSAGAIYLGNITAINGTTLTLSSNLLSTPAASNLVSWPAYAGHVYFNTTVSGISPASCTTGATQPVFPTTANGQVTDGTCTWTEYGPGMWARFGQTAAFNAVANLHSNFWSGSAWGIGDYGSGPVTTSDRFYQLGDGSIYCNACKSLNVLGTETSYGSWPSNLLFATGASAALYLINNAAISSPPACTIDAGGATNINVQNTQPICNNTAVAISGGGVLATGSNSYAGRITGLAATGNILTPGFSCPNAVTCTFEDDTTAGGVKVTAQAINTETFSATASDTADYVCGCR